MYSFLLIIPREKCPTVAGELLKAIGSVSIEQNGRYLVKSPQGMSDGWIAVRAAEDVWQDYDTAEIKKIWSTIADPCLFFLEGRNGINKLSDRFIENLESMDDCLVDNDHGLIESVRHVKSLIKAGEEWLYMPADE